MKQENYFHVNRSLCLKQRTIKGDNSMKIYLQVAYGNYTVEMFYVVISNNLSFVCNDEHSTHIQVTYVEQEALNMSDSFFFMLIKLSKLFLHLICSDKNESPLCCGYLLFG